jgi:hypothetical protein
MNDTISLNAKLPVTYLTVGIPKDVARSLRYWTASTSQGSIMTASPQPVNVTGGYIPVRLAVNASRPGNYTFVMKTVFSDLLSFNPGNGKLTFIFSPFPVVDSTVSVARATVSVRTGDWPSPNVTQVQMTRSGSTFNATTTQLLPFNATVGKMVFSAAGTNQNVFDVSAARTITISQSGDIRVADSYTLSNRGRDLSSFTLSLPPGASSIVGSDLIGRLDGSKLTSGSPGSDGTIPVTFNPRFGTVKTNGSASVVLEYALSGSSYITTSSLGRYSLTFQMFNNVKFVEASLQTKIMMPTGFRLGSFNGQTPVVSGNRIVLESSTVTPLNDLTFSMTYQLDPFWASLDPLGWAAVVEAGLSVLALVWSSGPGAVLAGPPSQLINRFVELYDEKSALRLEAEKMEEDLNRGAINKNDYKRRRRVIDLKIAEIDRTLIPVKEQLSTGQARYQDMLRRLERAEAELQVLRSSLSDLKNQYRGGRISRELYDSLSADSQRRKEKGQQTIDNVIIGLREEAR